MFLHEIQWKYKKLLNLENNRVLWNSCLSHKYYVLKNFGSEIAIFCKIRLELLGRVALPPQIWVVSRRELEIFANFFFVLTFFWKQKFFWGVSLSLIWLKNESLLRNTVYLVRLKKKSTQKWVDLTQKWVDSFDQNFT